MSETNDHDLLIRIDTKLDGLIGEQTTLRTAQSALADRVRSLELWRAGLAGALTLLTALVAYGLVNLTHLLGR